MKQNILLTIVGHIVGIVMTVFLFAQVLNDTYLEHTLLLLLPNIGFIVYYAAVGVLCNVHQKILTQIISLIPLSLIGLASWLFALLYTLAHKDNPFANIVWYLDWLYNVNTVLYPFFTIFQHYAAADIFTYTAWKLLYNLFFPGIFILAGMELKRFVLRKRGLEFD
ncbi:hypothetical protein DUZ99_12295 [Xylanibacillus composti]|uniref:Uncharacterized protein n=1 Tax=Xylanibacillus composti TaxID=1572762 RepID=A0A8J4M0X9_9BACL|nr:hypothetical protein [Xylanibacillus composti]MDT9725751.1 hypothetical protein [Xylanibacillus composti]GIQ67535.1 hypothetical protein XYCOK13_03590 [Xylanibacillus composti]